MDRSAIEPLLAPDSIAIVGASPDSWYASRLVDNLLSYGFDGAVYYVNPGRESIDGEPCYDSISTVPETVDLAVISIPREYVVETVRDAAARGIPAALVISAGFAEADDEGVALQAELDAVVDETGIALCGPNTIGFANMHDETVVTATCSRKPLPGSVGLVSQSGALAFSTFFDRGTDEDLHFAYIIATGNEVGLGFAEYIRYLADDPRVDVICIYLEGVTQPKTFMTAAAHAVSTGTPVMAVKIGRTDDAQAASVSHTGSITGNDDAWTAAFRQTGVERVEDIPELLHRASAHTKFDPPAGNRICVLSTSGGLASLLADLVSDRGMELPPLSPETEQRLLKRDDLLTFGEMPNPADIRGYGAAILPEIAEEVFADPQFDAYLIAVAFPAVGERAEPIRDNLLEIAAMADKPVIVCWTGRKVPDEPNDGPLPFEQVRQELPLFYDPARAVDALASLVEFGQVREQIKPLEARDIEYTPADIKVPADAILAWEPAAAMLGAAGIHPVESITVRSATNAVDAANTIGHPVVLKVDDPALPHRTDAGAVRVGLTSADAVEDAYLSITEAASVATGTSIDRVLVQPVHTGTEVLIGVTRDEVFGPVVTLGPGGELVELLDEASVLIPPYDRATVESVLDDGILGRLLTGYRGREPADVDALIDLVVRIGDLVTVDDRIAELDLNPVMVDESGVHLVDVLLRTHP